MSRQVNAWQLSDNARGELLRTYARVRESLTAEQTCLRSLAEGLLSSNRLTPRLTIIVRSCLNSTLAVPVTPRVLRRQGMHRGRVLIRTISALRHRVYLVELLCDLLKLIVDNEVDLSRLT